jgi:hypothetical protein
MVVANASGFLLGALDETLKAGFCAAGLVAMDDILLACLVEPLGGNTVFLFRLVDVSGSQGFAHFSQLCPDLRLNGTIAQSADDILV